MSERPSSGWPRSCSGDMNSSVPSVWPTAVRARAGRPVGSAILAMPKSSTLTTSSPSRLSTMMFSGFMSRWTMPRAWASPSASATWARIFSTRTGGSGPSWFCTSCRGRPRSSSMAR